VAAVSDHIRSAPIHALIFFIRGQG
jgi:hypothetical protein